MDENNQELRESMDRLTELMGNNNLLLENQARILMAGMKQEDIDKLKLEQVFGKNTNAVDGNTNAVDKNSRAFKANQEAAEEYKKAMDNYVSSLRTGADGLKKVFNNIISQDPSRSMAKYSDGLSTLGDAVAKTAENFGPLGKAVGASVQVFTKLAGAQMQQVDSLLKANDQLAQFGTAGSFTTKGLMDMAHGAGVTSKNMDTLINPIKSLGPALTNLGNTTGDGVKAFTSLAKITNQQREEIQRLGVSQEQLIQNQADYVKLQTMGGASLKRELADRGALQRASLEYTENLLVLSAVTGQDVDKVKAAQQEQLNQVNFQVKQIQLLNRAKEAEDAGRKDEAKKYVEQAKQMREGMTQVAGLNNKVLAEAAREMMATGTLTSKSSQAIARMGLTQDLQKWNESIKNGAKANEAAEILQNAYNDKFGKTIDKVGFSASLSEDIAEQFGINKESTTRYVADQTKDYKELGDLKRKEIEDAKKSGKDPAQDARAKLTTIEIEAGKAMDKFVALFNPLLKGFDALTISGTLAAAALGGVAVAAGAKFVKGIGDKGKAAVEAALGMGSKMGAPGVASPAAGSLSGWKAGATASQGVVGATSAVGGAGSAASAATAAGTALSKLAAPLAGLSKAAPMIGTVMSVGTGVVDAYQGIKKADKDLKEGKITKEEARVEKGEAVGGGAGTAIGGAAGALKGAAAGAAIGSVVPVLGTAVGGIIGAALGGWLGSKAGSAIGEVAGGSIAKMTSDADKKVDEASKKAESKKDSSLAKDTRSGSDVVKVSIVKVDDPNLMKALGGMTPATTMASSASASGSQMASAKPSSENKEVSNKLAQLEKQREIFEKKGPATGSAQSELAYKNILQQMDRAIANEKAKASAPKAAVGGIFDGPKSGYPVELHGKEMITPLGTGTKTASLDTSNSAARDEELEKEIEAIQQLKDSLKESDTMFTKLSGSIMKLNKIEEEKIEKHEEEADALADAQDKLKNVFKGAELDLSKFSGRVKVLTDTALGTGAGSTAPASTAPAGGAAGGTGVTPPSAPPMASMGGGTGVAPPVKQDVKQNLGDVKAALMKRGMGDEKYLNAVLGNVMKESGGKVINENLNYGKTSNDRIRSIFGSRARGKTDEELNAIKSSPESMGEFMYGKDTKIGRSMGNLEPGDGFKYRGRGYIQLTGKSNYAAASQAIFGDDTLVKNPDLVNDPKIAADVVAWYMERGKSSMAKKMGIDDKNMTQEQANLLATSQIAGTDVRKAGGYLGGEVMNKVAGYAASKDIQDIKPSEGGTMVAGVKKEDIPKAQKGGVFEGPETGYLVELHGDETVVPTEKIASIAKKPEKTQTITDTDAWKKILHSGIATNYDMGPAKVGTEQFGPDAGNVLGDRLKEIMEMDKTSLTDAIKQLQEEFKAATQQMVKDLAQNAAAPIVEGADESVMAEVAKSMSELVNKMSESNDIQGKILQYSQV